MHIFRAFVGAFKRGRKRAGAGGHVVRRAINLTLTASRMAAAPDPAAAAAAAKAKAKAVGRAERC